MRTGTRVGLVATVAALGLVVSVGSPALAQEYFGWINGKDCGESGFPYTSTRTIAIDDEHQIKDFTSSAIDRATWQNYTGQVQTHNNWTSFHRSEWAFVRTNQGSYLARDHACDY